MVLLYAILVFYTIVVLLKIIWGISGSNLSLLADGLDSLQNIFTLSTAVFFFRLSQKGRDETHHFGHTRYDAFGALLVGVFQIFVSGILGTVTLFKFGMVPEKESLKTSVISLFLMIGVTSGLFYASKKLKSEVISAEFFHEFIDLVQTAMVVFSTYLSIELRPEINSVFAFFISILLFSSGVRSIWRAEKFLLDWAPPPELISDMRKVIESQGVRLRDIKVSLLAQQKIRVEINVQADGELTLEEAHRISHQIEDEMRREAKQLGFEIENCTVHVEPMGAHR